MTPPLHSSHLPNSIASGADGVWHEWGVWLLLMSPLLVIAVAALLLVIAVAFAVFVGVLAPSRAVYALYLMSLLPAILRSRWSLTSGPEGSKRELGKGRPKAG